MENFDVQLKRQRELIEDSRAGCMNWNCNCGNTKSAATSC